MQQNLMKEWWCKTLLRCPQNSTREYRSNYTSDLFQANGQLEKQISTTLLHLDAAY